MWCLEGNRGMKFPPKVPTRTSLTERRVPCRVFVLFAVRVILNDDDNVDNLRLRVSLEQNIAVLSSWYSWRRLTLIAHFPAQTTGSTMW